MLKKLDFITKADATNFFRMSETRRVDYNLNKFEDYCLNLNKKSEQKSVLVYLKGNLEHTQTDCLKANMINSFCSTISFIADNFMLRGFKDLGSIFFTKLAKVQLNAGKFYDAEISAKKALDTYIENGDKAHIQARLTDLEKIYRRTGQKQSLFNVLKDKEFVLEDIIANYDTTKQSFKSLKKPFTSKNDFLIQLARTESDLGDLILRKNKAKALEYYRASERCYESANNKDCAEFIRYRAKNSDFLNIY